MIKAVLFDLGGTIHTSQADEARTLRYAEAMIDRLADYGIEIPDTPQGFLEKLNEGAVRYKRSSEKTLREERPVDIWSEYYLKAYGISKEALAPCAEELSFRYDYDRSKIMRRPHLKETMTELSGMGLKLGMISNIISESVVPHFLMEYGIYHDMDVILTSAETGIRKPDPGIFRIAEEKLGLTPDELAYVGDTISRDIIGTRNAGWKVMIQIPSGRAVDGILGFDGSEWKPDYTVTDLAEIPAIIRAVNAS